MNVSRLSVVADLPEDAADPPEGPTAEPSKRLSDLERRTLAGHERTIRSLHGHLLKAGAALKTIRDDRLFRETYRTFAAYCKDRWGFTASRSRQLIDAAETVTTVTLSGLPAPVTERQIRELVPLRHDPKAALAVWEEATTRHGARPTAKHVQEAIQRVRPDSAPPTTKPAGRPDSNDQPVKGAPQEGEEKAPPQHQEEVQHEEDRQAEDLELKVEDDRREELGIVKKAMLIFGDCEFNPSALKKELAKDGELGPADVHSAFIGLRALDHEYRLLTIRKFPSWGWETIR
jgi:hypothetical protein